MREREWVSGREKLIYIHNPFTNQYKVFEKFSLSQAFQALDLGHPNMYFITVPEGVGMKSTYMGTIVHACTCT